MASDPQDLTLAQLLRRALINSDKVTQAASPNDPTIQALLTSTLSDLTLANKLINHLGVLSPNETLDDISTRDLRCLLVDALQGHLCTLVRTTGGEDRLNWLKRAKSHFTTYLKQVEQYEVVPPAKRDALAGPAASVTDPARRRAGKIAQFKMEREIKETLEELRTRRRRTRIRSTAPSSSSSSSSSTPAPPADAAEDDVDFLSSDDDSTTDVARPLLINLLTLHYLRAHAELSSLEQELELLEHGMKMSEIPSPSPHPTLHGLAKAAIGGDAGEDARESDRRREKDAEEEETRWRLDKLSVQDSSPLLSPEGKVLRPFTILPSNTAGGPLSTRLRLQSEVFRPSHRLPTMSIDEYLAIEEERGNVLQGGGPSTSEGVEQARAEERAEEEDDTVRGYAQEEAKLRKEREFDDWKDSHRKGEGNMHNRG
ncbi:hypothetical protein JCM8097_003664 [Rhodosporidiobolus ruineniae]